MISPMFPTGARGSGGGSTLSEIDSMIALLASAKFLSQCKVAVSLIPNREEFALDIGERSDVLKRPLTAPKENGLLQDLFSAQRFYHSRPPPHCVTPTNSSRQALFTLMRP